MTMTEFVPTPHQQEAITAIEAALEQGQQAVLTGYAGTGKSALASEYFSRSLSRPLFLAPTNRACYVLRSKLPFDTKVTVMTIHAAAMRIEQETHADAIRLWEGLVRAEGEMDRCRAALDGWLSMVGRGNELKRNPINHTEWLAAEAVLRSEHKKPLDVVIERNLRRVRKANQLKFKAVGDEDGVRASTLLVDEASMVSLRMHEHLMDAFPRTPVLYVGDPAQLPPIVGEGERPGSVLDHLPATAELTEVLRQQGDDHPDSPKRIALFANYIRVQESAPWPNYWAGQVDTASIQIMTRPKSKITVRLLDEAAQLVQNDGIILTWRNDTRQAFNRKLRGRMKVEPTDGRPQWLPVAGERLICVSAPGQAARQEVYDPITTNLLGEDCTLTNGELIVLSEDAELVYENEAEERGVQWVRLVSDTPGFGKQALHVPATPFLDTYNERLGARYATWRKQWLAFDYGYCATVHKSQGSQFRGVMCYEQHPWLPPTPEQAKRNEFPVPDVEAHRKWLYTAISRAQERLVLVCEPKLPRGWK